MGQTCARCTNYNAQSCSCANSISKWYHEHNQTTITTRTCSSEFYGRIPGTTQPQICSTVTIVQVVKPYHAPKQCCDKCNIRANEVRVIFWPDTGASNTTTLKNLTITQSAAMAKTIEESEVVSDGFTYSSPSVYVSYKSLQAAISCVTTNIAAHAWTQMGPAHTTVRAYAPDALSSAKCVAPNQDGLAIGFNYQNKFLGGIFNGWEALDYQGLLTPPPVERLISKYQSCFPQISTKIPGVLASYMYASPRLSIPGDVTDIEPMWQTWGGGTCTPVGLGAFDPPRALTKKSTMITNSPEPTTAADSKASSITNIQALPAAAPTSFTDVTKTNDGAAGNPSILGEGSGLVSSSTINAEVGSPSLVTIATPVIDPVTTVDPNDPAFVVIGKDSKSKPANPVYQPPVNQVTSDQVRSPTPAVFPQANPQPSPAQSTQRVLVHDNVQVPSSSPSQAPASPNQNQESSSAPAADPNSVPITLMPAKPTPGPQNVPTTPSDEIARFIAQVFSSGSPQPIVVPNSQLNINGQPAQEAGSYVSNVVTDIPMISNSAAIQAANSIGQTAPPHTSPDPFLSNNQVVQSSNGGLQVGGQILLPGSLTTVSGHTINYPNPSSVVVDGNTYNVAPLSGSNPLVIHHETLQRGPNGALIVAGSTLQANQPASIAGHIYSLAGSSSIVVDQQSTYALPPTENAYLVQAQPTPTQGTPVSKPVTLANGIVIIPQPAPSPSSGSSPNQIFAFPNGETASAGGRPIIISGITYSALSSNQGFLVNGATTLSFPTPSPTIQQIFTIGNQIITPAPTGFIVASASISPGGHATNVAGTPISLDRSSHLYIGSSVLTLTGAPIPSVFRIGSQTVTPDPSGFLIAGTTIAPGGPAITISATRVSLDASSHLYIGPSTMTLSTQGPQLIFTVGSHTITPVPTGFAIATTSIFPGGPAITVSGTVLSLDSSSHLRIGSSTMTLGAASSPTPSIFTIGTQTLTVNPTGLPIASTSLMPGGPAVTIAGTLLSLGQNGIFVFGSSTITLPSQLGIMSSMANEAVTTVKATGSGTVLGSGSAMAESVAGAGARSGTSATLTGGGGVPVMGTNPPEPAADSQQSTASRKRWWKWWMMIGSWGFIVAISAFVS